MAEEQKLESRLLHEVNKLGGLAFKLVSPGYAGMPDRVVLFKEGKIAFIEVKAKGKKPRKLQLKRHEELRALGFKVYVLDDKEDIGGMLNEILSP